MNQKSTGIVRKIDDLGRIVLPAEMRRALDISVQDPVEIHVEGDHIILKKHSTTCAFCGSTGHLVQFHGKYICPDCLYSIRCL